MCIFKEYEYCKDVIKKHFNKNLVMTAEQNEEFEKSNICWICNKLIEIDDNKARDHCHILGKYRGATHLSRNINLRISKKVPVMFHNLRGYDSQMSNFNCKVSVIPNRLEKYMSFNLNNNIVFINSILFSNSSLDELVRNLVSENLKYLSKEFSAEKLELVKKERCLSLLVHG